MNAKSTLSKAVPFPQHKLMKASFFPWITLAYPRHKNNQFPAAALGQ
jgi:hypothetical protein